LLLFCIHLALIHWSRFRPSLTSLDGFPVLFTHIGLRTLQKRLQKTWKTGSLKEEVTFEKLSTARVAVFVGPRKKFNAREFDAMVRYVRH
jgi:hypothetical protein